MNVESISTDTVIAICSMIVAITAVIVALWQGWVTRSHNKKSITPNIEFLTDSRLEAESVGLFLKNTGLGPAIVQRVCISVGKIDYEIDAGEAWREILNHLGINQPWTQWHAVPRGSYIKANGLQYLLIANPKRLDQEKKRFFMNAIMSMRILIEYESVYGDRFNLVSSWNSPGESGC